MKINSMNVHIMVSLSYLSWVREGNSAGQRGAAEVLDDGQSGTGLVVSGQ